MKLIVYQNPEALKKESILLKMLHYTQMWKNRWPQASTEKYGFDAAIAGARRDEENHELKNVFFLSYKKSLLGTKRAKTRIMVTI